MMDDVKRAWGGINDVQKRMLTVTGTAYSEDRMIKAVVGPRGHLMELEIDPRVYRKPNSAALAASILDTVRKAVDDASQKSTAILAENTPRDFRFGQIAGMDMNTMLRSHDSDIVRRGDEDE
jgi:DNA-binding protein YbaB